MLRKFLLLLACALTAAPAFADQVRLNIGFWPGELNPELQPRLFNDDLVQGTSFGRFDQAWNNKETNTIYPLGAQYIKDGLGAGQLILGGNYIRYQPDYNFTGIGAAPSLSTVSLQNFKISDWEAQAGYRLGFLDKKFFVTPEFGARWHHQEYDYNELTIGNNTLATNLSSPFRATARGTFIGAGLQYYVAPKVSLLADYIMTTPIFGQISGSMTDKREVLGIVSGAPYLEVDNASAGYQVNLTRWMLGVQYDVTPELHIQGGLRQEVTESKYTGYFNLPILVTSGGFTPLAVATEIVTDKYIWEKPETQTKGFIFFGVSYDINL